MNYPWMKTTIEGETLAVDFKGQGTEADFVAIYLLWRNYAQRVTTEQREKSPDTKRD